MTKSWNNSDVVLLTSAPKSNVPTKNFANLWTDANNTSFCIWGGWAPFGLNNTIAKLYRFTDSAPGTIGAGRWTEIPAANPIIYNELVGTAYGAFTSAHGVGYLLGGDETPWTAPGRMTTSAVPGLLTYDMTSETWANSSTDVAAFGSRAGHGAAQFVPTFGPNGLIFVMGGWKHNQEESPAGDRGILGYNDLRNLTFFHPGNHSQYWQIATGDIPPSPRTLFCTVGFPGPEGTYEM